VTDLRPLRHADLFHTGIVVDDLETAKDELGGQLGLTWFEGGAAVRLLGGGGTRTVSTSYALSREGPHHVELTQSIDGTLWEAAAPGHAHHIGYWVDDVEAASAVLTEGGSPRVARVGMDDDGPPMCAYHRMPTGLYVEVVSRALRPVLLPTS
jgi:hypothetical protein